MARVTVLMPVYNGETFLRETMDSVLRQTYSDFIFFILNDGSTDKTEEIIFSYTDSRILYHKNDKNLGLVATLNKGIDLVDTEYLARMDADDLWVETKLEKQIHLLDARLDVGICGTSIHKFGAFEGDFIFPVENEGLRAGFLFYCCMSHPSVVFRMSFLQESGIRYRPDYFPAEDYKLWVECLDYTQIYNIPEQLVKYRQHNHQITQDSNSKQVLLTNRVRLEVLEKLSESFTQTQKDFHIYSFLSSQLHSVSDYKKFIQWSRTLLQANKTNGFVFNSQFLEEALKKHLRARYKSYIYNKYKSFTPFKSYLKYFFSLEWRFMNYKDTIKFILRV